MFGGPWDVGFRDFRLESRGSRVPGSRSRVPGVTPEVFGFQGSRFGAFCLSVVAVENLLLLLATCPASGSEAWMQKEFGDLGV